MHFSLLLPWHRFSLWLHCRLCSAHAAWTSLNQACPSSLKIVRKSIGFWLNKIRMSENMHLVYNLYQMTTSPSIVMTKLVTSSYQTFSYINKMKESIRFARCLSIPMVRCEQCTKMHTTKMLAELGRSATFRSTVFTASSHPTAVHGDVWFSQSSDGAVAASAGVCAGLLRLCWRAIPWCWSQLPVATVTHKYCFLWGGWCCDTKHEWYSY